MDKQLFHVRDASGKIVSGPYDDKMDAKRKRNLLQGKQDKSDGSNSPPRKFFVTFGKDHHTKKPTGKW